MNMFITAAFVAALATITTVQSSSAPKSRALAGIAGFQWGVFTLTLAFAILDLAGVIA